jgi:hypothetical protein
MASREPTDLNPTSPPVSGEPLMPVGAWVCLELPGNPVVGFTYVDQQAGFSAQGWKVEGSSLDQSSRLIVRLPMPGVPWRRLETHELQAFALESPPTWVVEFYGAQPMADTLWVVIYTMRAGAGRHRIG